MGGSGDSGLTFHRSGNVVDGELLTAICKPDHWVGAWDLPKHASKLLPALGNAGIDNFANSVLASPR